MKPDFLEGIIYKRSISHWKIILESGKLEAMIKVIANQKKSLQQ